MIPKKLTIQGVYSYQEKQTVDFETLTKSQLFGVFGAVGSGKSTLLEAISFSLYGKTERLGIQDNLKYNMMNLKSNELFIDFEFENFDSKKYRFIVEGKRNSKRFDDVRTFQRRAFVYENENWNPLESTSAESIIGLSYDNFRRTIIIPQGKFQEFLQLKDKDRTNMLKEIFNLSKFDYFYQIATLASLNDKEKEKLLGKLSHFDNLTQEYLGELKLKNKEANDLNAKLKSELEIIKSQEKSLSLLKESFTRLHLKKTELTNLNKEKETIAEYEKTYLTYEYALIHFKERFIQVKKLETKEKENALSLSSLKAELNLIIESIGTKGKQLKVLKGIKDNIPLYEKELKDLETIHKINCSKATLKENANRLDNGKLVLKNLNEEITQLEKNGKELNEAFFKSKKNQIKGSVDEFTKLLNWYKDYNFLDKEVKRIETDILVENARLNKQKNDLFSQLKDLELDTEINKKSQLEPLILKEQERLSKLKKEKELKEKTLAKLNVKKELELISKSIKEGEECPLCGSVEHSKKHSFESVESEIKSLVKEVSSLEFKIDIVNSNLFVFSSLTVFYSEGSQRSELLKKAKEEAFKKLKLKEGSFNSQSYSFQDEAKVKHDYSKFQLQEKSINEIKEKQEKSNDLIRNRYQKRERFKTEFEKIEVTTKSALLEIETYEKQLLVLSSNDHKNNKEITRCSQEVKAKILKTEKEYQSLESEVLELKKEQLVKEEKSKNLNFLSTSLIKELKEEKDLIKSKLLESSFTSLESVTSLLKKEINVQDLKKRVSEFNLSQHALVESIKQLEADLKDKDYNAEVYTKLNEELKVKTKALETQNELRIGLNSDLEKSEKDFRIKNELKKQLNLLENRGENIGTLKSLFKGSGFVNYISSVYLQNLCHEANVRFYQLTRQRLKLEINEKNEFLVRDYLNEGKLRSVKTLSGGQLFQASLSLALALAESIQQQNKANQNFFFLDEGFGSQDKESLQIVFESLKALRKENRIVGVISHVEELQQEITTYLQIINHNDEGSKIATSY